uniref:Arabidopsis retrotransposon Orf1 C-terminal domain-containing protein n=1 Tax=Chenopodium quinoa TaxID=63459 RepID=A0A803NDZ9_CHEQI
MSQRKRTRSTPQQQPQLDLESVTGCPHVVFVPEFPNQKQRFIELSRRKVIPTRFFDRSLLSKLGIDSECKNLFAKLGMSQLFNMNYRTYEDLTLEFLSSFDIEKGRNGLVKYVVYRLLNRSHRMSLEGFARKFGLPCTGLTVQPSSFISGELWFAMTGENIESFQHALSHKIHQPVLRLWTRFTGWTIFGRIEPNNVRSDEISFLGSYLRRGDEDGDFKMNIAHLSLVTHLALREGFDEASRCPVPGPITLDQHYLTTAGKGISRGMVPILLGITFPVREIWQVASAQNALPQEKKVEEPAKTSPQLEEEKAAEVAEPEQPKVDSAEEKQSAPPTSPAEPAAVEAENVAEQEKENTETKDDDQAVEEAKKAIEELEVGQEVVYSCRGVLKGGTRACVEESKKENKEAEVKEAREETTVKQDDTAEAKKPAEKSDEVKAGPAAAPAEPEAEAAVAVIEADTA